VNRIILGDCLDALGTLPDSSVRLAYIDPPFNTGKTQKRDRISVSEDPGSGRIGFGGRTYRVDGSTPSASFGDAFDDFTGFLMPRIEASLRVLTPDASLFVHLDYREVHYVKVALDHLLGRDHFMNEIVWAYDYGARSRTRWPSKHDTILWYVMNPALYHFDFEAMDRIPYMAPGLVSKEKAERGKTPTDVWWHTIVPTNGKEKTGYPTQKPLGILNRIVKVHSAQGDIILDFFCGSGTTGEAAAINGREFVLIDSSTSAVEVSASRLSQYSPETVGFSHGV
jgi:site-specific DNA-methyltransferase (adenine-specific)